MAYWPPTPPTRTLSFLQLVQEADPSFQTLLQRPVIYEFSNGRPFVQPLPYYADYADGIGYYAIGVFGIGSLN